MRVARTAGPAIVDAHVAAFYPSQFLKPLLQRFDPKLSFCVISDTHEDTDSPHPLALLRARRERPCSRRAAKQRDELAAFHSITSSARASSWGGTCVSKAGTMSCARRISRVTTSRPTLPAAA